jgi:FkbM family methyltransferase
MQSARVTLSRLRAIELAERSRADVAWLLDALGRRLAPPGPLRAALRAAGARARPQPRDPFGTLLERFAELRPCATFVQIGSHDGQQQDPLREVILRHGWRGVMVEPVPHVYARLRRHYGHLQRIELENAAIAEADGTRPFYHLPSTEDAGRAGLPVWYDALGSFRREVLLAHRRFIPDIDDRVVELQLPCLTFASLCAKHGLERLDLLQTDTEGSDYEILRTVPFERLRPPLVIYESVHLPPDERAACAARLRSFDYETHAHGLDTWCFNAPALSEPEAAVLVPLWRWLTSPDRAPRPLAITRVARRLARELAGPGRWEDELAPLFALSDEERRYLETGHRRAGLPAVRLAWTAEERGGQPVELPWFRGESLRALDRPQHPRATAIALLLYLRHLERRGGGELIARLGEDGAFGAWSAEIPGRGRVSRELLDSAAALLFLERTLGVLSKPGLRVLDVGAGYGRLAHRMAVAHPSLGDYCCVGAIPESTFVCEYYLAFRGVMPPARVLALDQLETLEPGSFDLAVDLDGLSVGRLQPISWWAQQLARLRVPHLLAVADQAGGWSTGGTRDAPAALAAAGYRQAALEPVIDDPALRELLQAHDRHLLFELAPARDQAAQAPSSIVRRSVRSTPSTAKLEHSSTGPSELGLPATNSIRPEQPPSSSPSGPRSDTATL